jgi:cell division protein ZapE
MARKCRGWRTLDLQPGLVTVCRFPPEMEHLSDIMTAQAPDTSAADQPVSDPAGLVVAGGPLQRYQALANAGAITDDPEQRRIAEALDDLHQRLVVRHQGPRPGWLLRTVGRWRRPARQPEKGLYIWGGVGRGKTFLVDLFYDSLPFERKLRIHFHRFMQRVHRKLTRLAGQRNPLEQVADDLAAEADVLCFDEFFVSDIGDAMILGELLRALFQRGVTLVTTSNVEPDRLYEDGLQRRRFLPAIDLLKRYTEVLAVRSTVDYRLRVLERAEIYHSPLDEGAEASLARSFHALVPDAEAVETDIRLEIEGREIPCRMCGDDVAWFEFSALCEGPRSQNDYIELARIFHAVVVGNVPVFRTHNEDAARRFISLVDEFYDRRVKLILSAAAPITELYQGRRLAFEFERTASRLLEMQSHAYLARSHLA